MKRLWITGVSLSIFVFFQLMGQETITSNRGEGTCWNKSIDANGYEIYNFVPSTSRCGWCTILQKFRDTAGSSIGWNGYIKVLNPESPEKSFYLGGGITPSRSLKFGKNAKIACFICQPDSTNCLPNDPARSSECFTGFNKISCTKQVNCSQVIEVTECYQEGKGNFSQVYNDLKLCGEPDLDLLNFSGAGASTYQAQDIASSVLNR